MQNVLKVAIMVVVLFVASPGWGSGNEWQVGPKPAETSLYEASVTPTVDAAPLAQGSVQNLPSAIGGLHTQGLLASTTWLKGGLATQTEVAANQGISAGDDTSTRMMRLGLTGSMNLVRYGMTYRQAGQAFYQGADQNSREAWGELKNDTMALRGTVGQQWNNVTDDPARLRAEQSYQRIGLSWNRPAWPLLELTYAQNAASNMTDSLGVSLQKASTHNLEAAFGYRSIGWDARLASNYGLEADLLHGGAEGHVQTQTATASFRPFNSLSIVPTLGYRVEQEWSGARIDSPSASLTLNYKQNRWLSMTAVGNYSETRSRDRLMELDNIGGKGILSWELEPVRDWTPQLSLEGGYNLQVNRLMPSAQTENLSGLLRLVLATL